jgi:hypothetical protein
LLTPSEAVDIRSLTRHTLSNNAPTDSEDKRLLKTKGRRGGKVQPKRCKLSQL